MGKEGKDWEQDASAGAHSFVEGSEEVDLLHEGIQPGLQLCLVQVGSVHLLGEETHHQNEVSFKEAEEKLGKGFLAGPGGHVGGHPPSSGSQTRSRRPLAC